MTDAIRNDRDQAMDNAESWAEARGYQCPISVIGARLAVDPSMRFHTACLIHRKLLDVASVDQNQHMPIEVLGQPMADVAPRVVIIDSHSILLESRWKPDVWHYVPEYRYIEVGLGWLLSWSAKEFGYLDCEEKQQ